MANPIFYGTSSTFGGALDMSGGVSMKVGTKSYGSTAGGSAAEARNARLAVQTAQIRANRPLQTFYDLFSTNVYYVAGRVQAQGNMDRLLGPRGEMKSMYADLSDPCKIGSNVVLLTIMGKFCTSGSMSSTNYSALDTFRGGNTVTLTNCAMQEVGLSMRAQDFVFMENFSFTAVDMLSG